MKEQDKLFQKRYGHDLDNCIIVIENDKVVDIIIDNVQDVGGTVFREDVPENFKLIRVRDAKVTGPEVEW